MCHPAPAWTEPHLPWARRHRRIYERFGFIAAIVALIAFTLVVTMLRIASTSSLH